MPSFAMLYQAAALCLTYPDEAFRARLPLLREAAPQLREFTDHAALTPADELAAHYVDVFAPEHHHSLYLTWWDDDTGRHRRSPARIEERYRAHGLELTGAQPPDFLPALLEFTARTGDIGLLWEHRELLERLRRRLIECHTPYASVLDAVCATLPVTGQARGRRSAGP